MQRPVTFKPPSVRLRVLSVEKPRATTVERGYDADWKRARLSHLNLHPLCVHCERRGFTTPANVVNHIEDICDRPDLRLDGTNFESLCKRCHDRHTRTRMNAKLRQGRGKRW